MTERRDAVMLIGRCFVPSSRVARPEVEPTRPPGFPALPLGSRERGRLCHGAGMLRELLKLLWKAAGFGSP